MHDFTVSKLKCFQTLTQKNEAELLSNKPVGECSVEAVYEKVRAGQEEG